MPNTREKLIELIAQAVKEYKCLVGELADHLIANGVTVQEWIPVTEDLPKCFGYFLVTLKDIEGAVYSGVAKFDPFAKSWKPAFVIYEKYIVTHWMNMPLPHKENDYEFGMST